MGTIFDRDHEPPESGPGDAAHKLVASAFAVGTAAASGNVALAAAAVVEVFQFVVTPPLEVERVVRLEELRDSTEFLDTLIAASQAAVATSNQERRSALCYAVMNSALPGAPSAAKQQIFIALVARFTEWHLRILAFFGQPELWWTPHRSHLSGGEALWQSLVAEYPALGAQEEFANGVWSRVPEFPE